MFMKGNRINHIRCAPYHSPSNGAVERFVQSFMQAMKASEKLNLSFQQRLMNIQLSYRSTSHSTTNVTAYSLFLNRQVRAQFDLLCPSTEEDVVSKQAKQKLQLDQHAKPRELFLWKWVLVRNVRQVKAWNISLSFYISLAIFLSTFSVLYFVPQYCTERINVKLVTLAAKLAKILCHESQLRKPRKKCFKYKGGSSQKDLVIIDGGQPFTKFNDFTGIICPICAWDLHVTKTL